MRALAALCVLAACFNPAPQPGAPCATTGDCPSGLECAPTNRCERPGAVTVDAFVPDACTTGVCEGDTLVGCGVAPIESPHGCGGPVAHCRELAPSNGLTTALLAGATADVSLDKLNFDANDGSIKMMNNDIRLAGVGVNNGIRFEIVQGVAVWAANTWLLPANEDWSFSGPRPATLYAGISITIHGDIDVGAIGTLGTLGGTSGNSSTTLGGCRGRAGRNIDATHGEGGGGGGGAGGQPGGNGGASNQGGTLTGIGGSCTTNPSTIPLAGGNGGGHGGANATNAGGAGGGAISLVAMESITITGDVAAPGAGGQSGLSPNDNGGGGGGGGGAILIEAPTVNITGRITANGGAGGAPSGGADGARGSITSNAFATGGAFMGGTGGRGATSMGGPTAGTSYNQNVTDPTTMVTTNYNRGAGGGGGAGKIEIKRATGAVSGLTSPAATLSNAVLE